MPSVNGGPSAASTQNLTTGLVVSGAGAVSVDAAGNYYAGASPLPSLQSAISGGGSLNLISAIFLGDSRTQQNFGGVVNAVGYTPKWIVLGNAALGWPFNPINGGVSGNTVADMLLRLPGLLAANPGPGWLVIRGMVNDIASGNLVAANPTGPQRTKETIVADLAACIALGKAAGKRIALCTDIGNLSPSVQPINAQTAYGALMRAAFSYINGWIRSQCATNGYTLIDIETAMMDPATGSPLAGSLSSADGIHENYIGGAIEARAFYTAFANTYATPRVPLMRFSSRNLLGPTAMGVGTVTADTANDTRIVGAGISASVAAWAATTAYTVGQLVIAGGRLYVATGAGTSGSVAPVHTADQAVDGTVVWKYVASGAAAGIPSGWSLTLQRTGGAAVGIKVARASTDLAQGTVAQMAFSSTASWGGAGFSIGGDPDQSIGRWDTAWAGAGQSYAVGRRVSANGCSYVCVTAGVTSGSDPTAGWSTQEGALITDNTAVFLCQRKPLAGESLQATVDIDTSSLVGNVSLRVLFYYRDTAGVDTIMEMTALDVSGVSGVAGTWLPPTMRLVSLPLTIPANSPGVRGIFVRVVAHGENGSSSLVTVRGASAENLSV